MEKETDPGYMSLPHTVREAVKVKCPFHFCVCPSAHQCIVGVYEHIDTILQIYVL